MHCFAHKLVVKDAIKEAALLLHALLYAVVGAFLAACFLWKLSKELPSVMISADYARYYLRYIVQRLQMRCMKHCIILWTRFIKSEKIGQLLKSMKSRESIEPFFTVNFLAKKYRQMRYIDNWTIFDRFRASQCWWGHIGHTYWKKRRYFQRNALGKTAVPRITEDIPLFCEMNPARLGPNNIILVILLTYH